MTTQTVLIVDDEEMVRTALEQWLRLSGFVTHMASDAGQALAMLDDIREQAIEFVVDQAARQQRPDAISGVSR